jgi:hypothetical protein
MPLDRRKRRGIAFVLLACVTALVTTFAFAQKPAKKPAASQAPTHKKPDHKKKDAGVDEALDAQAPLTARAESTSAAQVGALKDAGTVSAQTLDGGARVFRFGEMEIEGRLRSPQLVYFLRRVRAEFAAGDLGHRSFTRELSDTRRDPSF